MKINLILVGIFTLMLISVIAVPPAFAADRSTYNKPFVPGVGSTVESDFCDTATQSTQCSTALPATAPEYVKHTLDRLGVKVTDECSSILIGIISSGNPNDIGLPGIDNLSTNMGNPGCGLNPDGFETNDCVDVTMTADVDSTIIVGSAEWPEYLSSSFTDWMRLTNGGEFNFSITDWPPASVATIDYGPDDPIDPTLSAGALLASSVAQGETVTLRVADSGDSVYDTYMLVIPAACAETPAFCGDDDLQPGEQCDDGNDVNGDGCSAQCSIENGGEVAGESLKINTTSLFVSGLSSSLSWMVPVLVGIAGAGVYFIRTTNK